MTEIRFYQLTQQSLDQALPGLLERTLGRGWKAVVQVPDAERMDALDSWLWSYRDDSFLPHGTAATGSPAEQPVFLTTDDVRPNEAEVLFLCDGLTETAHAYQLICLIFSGADASALANARAAWTRYKEAGHELTYWQQGDTGGWEKKA